MDIKKIITVGIMAFAAMLAFAEPMVTDVTAKQRYPWNGMVDITCKVTGLSGTAKKMYFSMEAVLSDSSDSRNVSHFWVVRNGTNSTDLSVNTDSTFRLLWDAKADLGQVRYDNMVVRVTLETHKKIQLWSDGPYWAEMNIGAEEPEEYGYYFLWGDTVGYKRENDKWVASDGSSSNFSFDSNSTPTYNKPIDTLKSEGWITADNVLAPAHDVAHVHWGGNWRMPTKQELADLNSKCEWTWTTMNGVIGYVVSGKGDYSSASIFLPCAGYGFGTSLRNAGSGGYYWSSVPNSGSTYAWYLRFDSSGHGTGSGSRYFGHSVRPVQGFTE